MPKLPTVVLRSEPSTVRFKGKSQAIGDRRLAIAGPRPSQVLKKSPLVRTPAMLAWQPPPPDAARLRRFWSTAPEGSTGKGRIAPEG